MKNTSDEAYISMWDEFAERKASQYLDNKYDLNNIVGLVGRAREHEALRLLAFTENDTFLDVGCASGHQVFVAAKKVKRAVGIDVGKEFIAVAKRHADEIKAQNVEFQLTDGSIPFPDHSFTKLLCSEVVEHLVDPYPLLAEIKRVLVPGGTVVFTVPNLNSRGTLWKRLLYGFKEPPFTPLTDFSAEAIKAHGGDAHVVQFTLARFRALIESAEFSVDYVGGAGYIDGPKMGRIIELTNRLPFFQWLTFSIEKICARISLFKALSRQIILRGYAPQK